MKLTLARSGWLALLAALVTLAPAPSFATNYNWVGTGTDSNWFSGGFGPYTSGNWNPGTNIASTGTNNYTFNNSTNLTNTVNGAGPFGIGSLTFGNAAGAFTINPTNGLNFEGSATAVTVTSNTTQTFSNTGNVSLNATGVFTVNTVNANSKLVFQGQVLGTGTSLTKSGPGELVFNGAVNASALGLNVTGGTVTTNAGYNGTGGIVSSGNSTVSLGGWTNTNVTASGNSTVIFRNNGAAGPVLVKDNANVINNGQTLPNLTIQGGTVTQTGVATYSGTTVINGAYVNTGTGAVTFTGPVNITSGSQSFVDATITGLLTMTSGNASGVTTTNGVNLSGGSIDFNAGATNTGSNAMNLSSGNVTIAGTSYGVLTSAGTDVNMGSGLLLTMGVNQDGSKDQLLVSAPATLTYNGNLNIDLTNTGSLTNYQNWQIFSFAGASQTGDFLSVNLNPVTGDPTYAGLSFIQATSGTTTFDQKYGAGVWLSDWTSGNQRFIFDQKTGILTVVPEPSTIVFAGIGAAMLGWHTWTRGRRNARMKLIEEHMRKVGEERGIA